MNPLVLSSDSPTPVGTHLAVFRMACRLALCDTACVVSPPQAALLEQCLTLGDLPDAVMQACWACVLTWAEQRGAGMLPILDAQYQTWRGLRAG